MFQIESECHSDLKGALKELLDELKEIKQLQINGKHYNLEMKLGGDMKCIALLLGLNAANAKHACCWCHCNLKETVDLTAEWPISRTQSTANIQYLAKENGYKYEPIIQFIDFENVVIDMLHLLLRITDRLYELILEKLTLFDRNDSICLEQRHAFSLLEAFLKDTCKITKPFYISQNDEETKIKLRSLNGSDR